jgi:hypothetical protein
LSPKRSPTGGRKDLEILGQILKRIHNIQEKYWSENLDLSGSKLPRISRDNYEFVATNICPPIRTEVLASKIKACTDGNTQLIIGNLFMPPLDLDKEFVPVLSIMCDPRSSNMRLCVGMFSFTQKHSPLVFAFRFETAHLGSNHDYHHGQFTRTWTYERENRRVTNVSTLPGWMPQHIPCVILPSKSSVSLMICMLISFYGERLQKHISDLNIDGKYLEAFEYLPSKGK